MNTLQQRRIAHEAVEAWEEARRFLPDTDEAWEAVGRMHDALDAVIALATPGYNAESEPELPEEYGPDGQPTPDAAAAWARWEA